MLKAKQLIWRQTARNLWENDQNFGKVVRRSRVCYIARVAGNDWASCYTLEQAQEIIQSIYDVGGENG